jgi:hydrogenase nickel incorporation protein HypB
MCAICGCAAPSSPMTTQDDPTTLTSTRHTHASHTHGDHTHDDHAHDDHAHDIYPHTNADDGQTLHFGQRASGVHVPGLAPEKVIRIERDILEKNNAYARANRARIRSVGGFALNLVSSPGSGKTTLLVRAIDDLKSRLPVAVIEGDQQTSRDAERIRAAGAPAVQINTGNGCHLDAHMVGHALDSLPLPEGVVLFVENVGNLVCPAAFDLGEAHKVVVLSVTEGEDKPLKYPNMFAAADLMLINKADLIPYLDFDVATCIANARRINPRIETLIVSAKTGAGMTDFYAWMETHRAMVAVDVE